MTCIVGVELDGQLWLGGDAASTRDHEVFVRKNPKVFKVENMLIGFSGSFRIGQLLQFSFKPVQHVWGRDDFQYIVTSVVDSIRGLLNENGAMIKDEMGDSHDSEFIIGYRGKFYIIDSDFHVEIPTENYVATGTGAAYALGALHAMKKHKISPAKKIHKALSAAEEYCTGVRKPFTILSMA